MTHPAPYATVEDFENFDSSLIAVDDRGHNNHENFLKFLELGISVASGAIDEFCNRFFYQRDETRRVAVPYSKRDYLRVKDILSVSSLTLVDRAGNDTVITGSDLPTLEGSDQERPNDKMFITGGVEGRKHAWAIITGRFGWTSVPDAVKEACLIGTKMAEEAPTRSGASSSRYLLTNDYNFTSLLGPYRLARFA